MQTRVNEPLRACPSARSRPGAPIRIFIFDDRLELEKVGIHPCGLTVEDLEHGMSKLRNRVIGRVFRSLGLIEQRESGIQRMTVACSEAGLADPRSPSRSVFRHSPCPDLAAGAGAAR